MSASHFREFEVCKAATELAKATNRIAARVSAEERYGLARRLQRAAVPIPSNIAEDGARRSRADCARFVSIATGSTAGPPTQARLVVERGRAEDGQVGPARAAEESERSMLFGLIEALLGQAQSRSPLPGPLSPDPEFPEGA